MRTLRLTSSVALSRALANRSWVNVMLWCRKTSNYFQLLKVISSFPGFSFLQHNSYNTWHNIGLNGKLTNYSLFSVLVSHTFPQILLDLQLVVGQHLLHSRRLENPKAYHTFIQNISQLLVEFVLLFFFLIISWYLHQDHWGLHEMNVSRKWMLSFCRCLASNYLHMANMTIATLLWCTLSSVLE